ncbi:enterobacterial common antigen polymerase [Vespertiliibacter pulmonis]|uniref:Antigen polymerase n=1 Tax=Vespertiliibacter pulmonis TaxID=1443036 RepID=A0A3N4W2F5_9PAST|nr:ECA oligosaccharide polymerase [Vespertiliibacter pulmonis]QLB20957.1 enterobacterial common antigen polymerase [Vespertiliibacter pulmonis]RPE83617.1 antigen polymerase [Vespertiliibacter pulmonis]
MQIADFLLINFYLLGVFSIGVVIYQAYQRAYFSFHLIFSVIYFVTFFLGFPFSLGLQFGFGIPLPQIETLFFALAVAMIGYLIYFLSYQFFQITGSKKLGVVQNFDVAINVKKRAKLTACLLFLVAAISLGYFIAVNGLLLFRLEKYSQIFSPLVHIVALKRFFYFFFPALLILYFIYPSKKRWWLFLVLGIGFGILSYLAVGGTRANIVLAFALFLLLGWIYRYFSIIWFFSAGVLVVVAMFFLALFRYKLDVQGSDAWFAFLYLTRDTFSPWENLAKLLGSEIKFQGLMPIVADFYVYIPKSLWAERPDIVWNTANYFTKIVLGNESGLAISPTLLGSFYIMGGFPVIGLGMALLGGLLSVTDRLFDYGRLQNDPIIQAYCLANLFNLMVLVREGAEAFISRWVFFSVIFCMCWLLAFLITKRKSDE